MNSGQFKLKYTVNENFLDTIGTSQAFFLGLMAADGHINKNYRNFSICQSHQHGLDLISYIKILLNSDTKIYYKNKVDAHLIHFTSPKLTKKLINIGITPNKSLTLKWPDIITEEFAPAFLRGYIDGDGSIGIYKRGAGTYLAVSYVGTEEFIEKSLTFIPVNKLCHFKIKRAKNLFSVQINGYYSEIFCKWLYSDEQLFNSHKKKKYELFMTDYSPEYRITIPLRIKNQQAAKELYESGEKVAKISSTLNLNFRLIYAWIKKYKWERKI